MSDVDTILSGYPELKEKFKEFWNDYVRKCEMGSFAPIGMFSDEYVLEQVDRDVWAIRESVGLHDEYQFYLVLVDEAEYAEIWGVSSHSASAECCLLLRNYNGYEYCEEYGPEEESL